jgi:hypothetical protein
MLGRSDSGGRAAFKSAAINRHKPAVPPSAAPAYSLWLRDVMFSNKAD